MSLTGIFSARRLKIRSLTVDCVLLFISLLQNDVSYTLTPLCCAVENAADCPALYLLDFLPGCTALVRQGMDFPAAWSRAVEQSRTLLNKQERNQLVQMGYSLSRSDSSGQKRIFDFYREAFTLITQKARSDRQKYTGLISVAGVLLSALTAVILI